MNTRDITYIASCGDGPNTGIYAASWENDRFQLESFIQGTGVSYLIYSQDKRHIYAAIETFPVGGVAAYAVGEGGRLALVNQQTFQDGGTCHVALSPNGRWLFAANYCMGRVYQFPILEDGSIGPCVKTIQHVGSGPVTGRQDRAHVHYCIVSPDGQYLCTVDLGTDEIYAYPLTDQGISEEGAVVSPIAPAGSGPRHFLFSQDGRHGWLLNELANTVMSFDYADGRFSIRQTLPMLPDALSVYSKASAIRFSPDGRFVLTSNRGYCSLNVWQIQADFTLKSVSFSFAGIKSPRDFNFFPNSNKVMVGGELSQNIVCFDFDAENGMLIPDGNVIENISKPICFLG